mmetsp:Transcript_33720/g.100790  ORF Transcript_33720/g.100790 Transcript_33720/m.100790 type:complete len:204 (-) Transcript_33720:385-996(-)
MAGAQAIPRRRQGREPASCRGGQCGEESRLPAALSRRRGGGGVCKGAVRRGGPCGVPVLCRAGVPGRPLPVLRAACGRWGVPGHRHHARGQHPGGRGHVRRCHSRARYSSAPAAAAPARRRGCARHADEDPRRRAGASALQVHARRHHRPCPHSLLVSLSAAGHWALAARGLLPPDAAWRFDSRESTPPPRSAHVSATPGRAG